MQESVLADAQEGEVMDTSKTNIKMADCPEIQKQLPEMAGKETYQVDGLDGRLFFHKGVEYHLVPSRWRSLTANKNFTWLPYQHQLQEMVGYSFATLLVEFEKFTVWRLCECSFPPETMEQLWLAFVMKEKYGKVWSGSNWITK
ncbi:hypothetical protein LCGC14_1948180 [marine sediment metagenome]|uniref:Uncharacterized protein n=1 Tax=marine sediment metagenome TaxID=412755 RepID=A0A0F9FI54_9ZZZZ